MPPNTRMQRTRSSASPPRSPLMRSPLGARSRVVALATLVVLGSVALRASEVAIALHVSCPATVNVGKKIVCRFEVANTGSDSVYFKQPWKWVQGGMQILATGPDGVRYESTPELFDIDGAYLCTFFKPLNRGDRYSFDETLIVGPKPVVEASSPPPLEVVEELLVPHLELLPGRYSLRWVYEPMLYDDEKSCAAADVRIWQGHIESNEIQLNVIR